MDQGHFYWSETAGHTAFSMSLESHPADRRSHSVQYACSRLTGFAMRERKNTRRDPLRSTSASIGSVCIRNQAVDAEINRAASRGQRIVFRSLAIFGGVSWKSECDEAYPA